jgi:predicted transcriptional regulator
LGPRGSKNRKRVIQRLKNGQEMHNDLGSTLWFGTFSYFDLWAEIKAKKLAILAIFGSLDDEKPANLRERATCARRAPRWEVGSQKSFDIVK